MTEQELAAKVCENPDTLIVDFGADNSGYPCVDIAEELHESVELQAHWEDRFERLMGRRCELVPFGKSLEQEATIRREASKKYADMVRAAAKNLPDKSELETLDVYVHLERLARAIEDDQ